MRESAWKAEQDEIQQKRIQFYDFIEKNPKTNRPCSH